MPSYLSMCPPVQNWDWKVKHTYPGLYDNWYQYKIYLWLHLSQSRIITFYYYYFFLMEHVKYYYYYYWRNSYCIPTYQHAWLDKSTPLVWSAWSMALSAMMVECERFIYYYYYYYFGVHVCLLGYWVTVYFFPSSTDLWYTRLLCMDTTTIAAIHTIRETIFCWE